MVDIVSMLSLQAKARRNALAATRALSRRQRDSADATAALDGRQLEAPSPTSPSVNARG